MENSSAGIEKRYAGIVTFFNSFKHYGFVLETEGRVSLFFHVSGIRSDHGAKRIPKPGERVSFVVRESRSKPGMTAAFDLVVEKAPRDSYSQMVSSGEVSRG